MPVPSRVEHKNPDDALHEAHLDSRGCPGRYEFCLRKTPDRLLLRLRRFSGSTSRRFRRYKTACTRLHHHAFRVVQVSTAESWSQPADVLVSRWRSVQLSHAQRPVSPIECNSDLRVGMAAFS